MALRKASSYSKRPARPYTRKSSKRSQSYIRTIPPQKVVKFNMGNEKDYTGGKFNFTLRMQSNQNIQMRDVAIEAARQYVSKELETNFPNMYFFQIKVFPHHILRENKMLTGAGADRMQTGMQLSFGKTIGRAALVRIGSDIFVIHCLNQKVLSFARASLGRVKSKLPGSASIITEIRR